MRCPPSPPRPQVHLLDRKGTSELIAVQEAQPSYQQVEVMLRARPTSKVNMCGDALQMKCVGGEEGVVSLLGKLYYPEAAADASPPSSHSGEHGAVRSTEGGVPVEPRQPQGRPP